MQPVLSFICNTIRNRVGFPDPALRQYRQVILYALLFPIVDLTGLPAAEHKADVHGIRRHCTDDKIIQRRAAALGFFPEQILRYII